MPYENAVTFSLPSSINAMSVACEATDEQHTAQAEEVRALLQHASDASYRVRLRVTLGTTVVGSVMFGVFLTLGQLIHNNVLSGQYLGQGSYYQALAFFFGAYIVVGIMPSDNRLIRFISGLFCVVGAGLAVFCAWTSGQYPPLLQLI